MSYNIPSDSSNIDDVTGIPAMVGDSGAGGTKGMAPAPSAGDAAAGRYLKADGTWAVPPGSGSGITELTGDVTAGPGSGSQAATIANDAVTYAKLQNVAGYSVPGKATTGSGDAADITAADETVLGRTGAGNLAFAQVATGQIANTAVTAAKMVNSGVHTGDSTSTFPAVTISNAAISYAKIQNGGALSVAGRSANSAGVMADISASAASGAVLRESGSTLGFGTVANAGIADGAISDSKFRDSAALSVIGRSANSTGDPSDISATAASGAVLRESGSALGFGTVATAGIADAAVTLAKMANLATDKLIGRVSSGTGVPEAVACTDGAQAFLGIVPVWGDLIAANNTPTWAVVNVRNYKNVLIANDNVSAGFQAGVPFEPMDKTTAWIQMDPAVATNSNVGFVANWTSTVTGTARASKDDSGGLWNSWTTGTVSGNVSKLVTSAAVTRREWTTDAAFIIKTFTNIANIRIWVGLFSATPEASATPAVSYAGFRYDTGTDGTAFWRAASDSGTGTPEVTTTDRSIATSTAYKLVVRLDSTSAKFYVGGTNLINSGAVCEHLTKLPAAATNLFMGVYVTTLTNAAKELWIGRCALQHN